MKTDNTKTIQNGNHDYVHGDPKSWVGAGSTRRRELAFAEVTQGLPDVGVDQPANRRRRRWPWVEHFMPDTRLTRYVSESGSRKVNGYLCKNTSAARIELTRHVAKVVRRFLGGLLFWSSLLFWPSLLFASDPAQDSASMLAQILAQKGTISSEELHQVLAASSQDRVSVLASILRDRGLLDPSDIAKLSPPGPPPLAGPSSASPVGAPRSVAASSPNASPVPAQAEPAERVEANTGKHIPVTIYGTLLFNAGFDGAGLNLNDAGSVVEKPNSSATATDHSFFETPRQTRLGIRLNPTEVAGAQLTGDFEMDAYSAVAPFADGINMGLFRIRLAYGRLDWQNFALEIGQDWSIFAPLNPTSLAMYAVAEFNGSGNPWIRIPQIRLEAKQTLNSSNRFLYQIAASDPNDGDFSGTFTGSRPLGAGELGRMPAIESRLAWSISDGDRDFTLGFSGRYGHGKNVGTINNMTVSQSVDSWGAAVDYSLPFTKMFNLTGETYMGRALGIYDVALGEDVGAAGTPGGHGVLSRGGWSQAQFNLNKHWQVNAGYGIDQPSAHDLPMGSRYRNENVFANFIYSMTANIQWSLEYRRLLSYYRNQPFDTGRADQFTVSAAYIF